MRLILRIMKTDLLPHWRSLLLRVILLSVIALVPYAFSMLGRWLVDEVLKVSPSSQIQKVRKKQGNIIGKYISRLGLTIKRKAVTQEEAIRLLCFFVGASLAIHFLATLLGGSAALTNSRLIQRITFNLRQKIHQRLYQLDGTTFGREQVGQLTARILNDSSAVPGNLINLVVNGITQGLMLIVGICLLVGLNPKLSLIIVGVLPAYGIVCGFYLPRIRRNSEAIRDRTAIFKGFILERLVNILTIKSYAQEDREINRFNERLDDNQELVRTQQKLNLSFNSLRTLIQALGGIIALAIGFTYLRKGTMTLGDVLAFHQVTAHLFVPISALVGLGTVVQNLSISAKRLFAVLDAPIKLSEPDKPFEPESIDGAIRFENVSMQFQEDGPFALSEVSLDISAGSHVCLVGPTGCGKSTVISLVTRLFDPDSGRITLDGIDLKNYRLGRLRQAIGNVFHQSPVFTGTLAENIAFGGTNSTVDDIEQIGRLVGLNALADSHENGYQMPVGSGGLQLDRADLARLSFARALIGQPQIMTVDDTFAALNEEAEDALLSAVNKAIGDHTWLIATSRLSICPQMDQVIVMQQGRIIQVGHHNDLMATPGLYRQMYYRQMGGPPSTQRTL